MGDVLKSGDANEMRGEDVSRIGGLFAALIIRVLLTVLATTLRIPAGFFTPMILIGGIIGRIFGHAVQFCVGDQYTIYIAGYAMVGAAAFASGTTHTISAAVVMLESTGQFSMFLPCLMGAIVGSGIVKGHTVSLYNQGLINKGLESFEQLLQESGDFDCAKDMMDSKVVYVQRNCQIGDLLSLMEHGKLATFPVIDNIESCKLLGSISRKDVYAYLKKFYGLHKLSAFVRQMLPEDTKQDDYSIARKYKMQARTQWLRTQIVIPSEVADEKAMNDAAALNAQNGVTMSPLAALANALSISSHGVGSSSHGAPTAAAAQTQAQRRNSFAAVRPDEELGRLPEEGFDEDEEEDLAREGEESSSSNSFANSSFNGGEVQMQSFTMGGNTIAPGHKPTQPRTNIGPTSIQIEAMLTHQLPPPPTEAPPPRPTSAPAAISSSADSQIAKQDSRSSFASLQEVARMNSHLDMAMDRVADALKSSRKKRIAELAHMTQEQSDRAQLLLKHTIDLVHTKAIPINPDPFMVHMSSPVDQVYMIFNTVKVNCVFVVEEDLVLQGMISQTNLMQRLKKKK